MKTVFVLAAATLLSGCYSDQVKMEGACELAARRNADIHEKNLPWPENETLIATDVTLCMQSHGYLLSAEGSMCKVPSSPRSDQEKIDEEMAKLAAQDENAICYRPVGWLSRQINGADLWFRRNL